jgi:hypothetical protein
VKPFFDSIKRSEQSSGPVYPHGNHPPKDHQVTISKPDMPGISVAFTTTGVLGLLATLVAAVAVVNNGETGVGYILWYGISSLVCLAVAAIITKLNAIVFYLEAAHERAVRPVLSPPVSR